jgi:hypothetical protein
MDPASQPHEKQQQLPWWKKPSRGFGHWVLAVLLLVIFLVTVILTLLAARHPSQWEGTKEALNILLPIETGFLGTVIGYYFGTKPPPPPQ